MEVIPHVDKDVSPYLAEGSEEGSCEEEGMSKEEKSDEEERSGEELSMEDEVHSEDEGSDRPLWEVPYSQWSSRYRYIEIEKHGDTRFVHDIKDINSDSVLKLRILGNQGCILAGDFICGLMNMAEDHEKTSPALPPEVEKHLAKRWKIPSLCFQAPSKLFSGAMTFEPVPGDDAWKGYLIRNDRSWAWACTLSLIVNASKKLSYGICTGLKNSEIKQLTMTLRKKGLLIENPLLVPVVLTTLYIPSTTVFNARHRNDLFNIQASMKTTLYINGREARQAVNLTNFAKDLTALSSSSAGITQLCSTQSRIIKFLEKQIALQRKEDVTQNKQVVNTLAELLEFAKQMLEAEQQHNAYIKESAQAHVQMVYSLTAQRDNESNLRMAELSQHCNEQNLKISGLVAQDSRLNTIIAKSSLRYGIDMRLMAATTLVFLPGTFVATLFSTSFWNFEPQNQGPVVSKWVSLYWILTLILTLVVLGIWRIFFLRISAKIKNILDWELDQMTKMGQDVPVEWLNKQRGNEL